MGADDTVQALMSAVGGRLDAIERTEAAHHADVLKRLDVISLNGDAPALRQLAKATPDLLRIASHADALDRIAKDDEDSRAGWRWVRARVHWDHGVGTVVKWVVSGAIAALTLFLVARLFAAPASSVLPSLPRVTPAPVVTVSPIPVVTP